MLHLGRLRTALIAFQFFFSLSTVQSQLAAPENLAVSNVTFSSFIISYTAVQGALMYEVNARAIYNSSDVTSLTISTDITTISGRRPNIIYDVTVRAIDNNGLFGDLSSISTRTAPNGCTILQTITTPTFITVFLEGVPGATGWEVQYTNIVTNQQGTISVPGDNAISMTHYVGIITSLNPNTNYSLQARVSQTLSNIDFTVNQSPYGTPIIALTDRISVFSQVEFLTENFTASDLEDSNLVADLQDELTMAYIQQFNNVFNLSIIIPSLLPNNFVFVEILLDDQQNSPNIDALVSPNPVLYNTRNSPLQIGLSAGDGGISANLQALGFAGNKILSNCAINSIQANSINLWRLFDDNGEVSSARLESNGIRQAINFQFNQTEASYTLFMENNDPITIFNFMSNTIYGIEQTYVVYGCLFSDLNMLNYFPFYEASLNQNADRYTIFYSTDLTSVPVEMITYEVEPDQTSVTLSIPSNLVDRVVSYQFIVNETQRADLKEEDLDSSSTYSVIVSGLARNQVNTISVQAAARDHNNMTSTASSPLVVTTTSETVAATTTAPQTTTITQTTTTPQTTTSSQTTTTPQTTTTSQTTTTPQTTTLELTTTTTPQITTAIPQTTSTLQTTTTSETTTTPQTTTLELIATTIILQTTTTPEIATIPQTTIIPQTTATPEIATIPQTTTTIPQTTTTSQTTTTPQTTTLELTTTTTPQITTTIPQTTSTLQTTTTSQTTVTPQTTTLELTATTIIPQTTTLAPQITTPSDTTMTTSQTITSPQTMTTTTQTSTTTLQTTTTTSQSTTATLQTTTLPPQTTATIAQTTPALQTTAITTSQTTTKSDTAMTMSQFIINPQTTITTSQTSTTTPRTTTTSQTTTLAPQTIIGTQQTTTTAQTATTPQTTTISQTMTIRAPNATAIATPQSTTPQTTTTTTQQTTPATPPTTTTATSQITTTTETATTMSGFSTATSLNTTPMTTLQDCNNRSDAELCSGITCSTCSLDSANSSSYSYSCPCSTLRSNPCPGMSSTVLCAVDFCSLINSLCSNEAMCVSGVEEVDCLCNTGSSVLVTDQGIDCVFTSSIDPDPSSPFSWWYAFVIITPVLMVPLVVLIWALVVVKPTTTGGTSFTLQTLSQNPQVQI